MARDPKYDILFEPVQIGPKTLKNRFFQAAHCSGAGAEKPGMQAAMRGLKAEGGWAAVSTEYCVVAPDGDDFHRIGARLWDEGDVRNLSLMCDAVHEHGALAVVELCHGPGDTPAHETRTQPRSLHQVQSKFDYLRTPRAMTKREIRDTQLDFVRAARRARAAGFDVVTFYVAMANGLPHMLLLPIFNTRSDEYGGSFENRARYSVETLELLREAVDDDLAIAVRFGLDTLPEPYGLGDGGIRAHGDGLRFATPSGKAVFHCRPHLPPAELPDDDYPFVLMTGRALEQFNAGTMTRRSTTGRLRMADTLEIAPSDAASGRTGGSSRLLEGR